LPRDYYRWTGWPRLVRFVRSDKTLIMAPGDPDITTLLVSWRAGDPDALNQLLTVIRRELRAIARRHLAGERHDHSMEASSLLNEAVLRLLSSHQIDWQSRAHFFGVASQVMRHVLVDHARRKRRLKRGGPIRDAPIDAATALTSNQLEEVIAVDLALQRLAQRDERKSKVFEMRFFGGLTVEETASALGISENTVIRDWSFARAWLRRELGATSA
jgi:RNA polymerase sigma factor (TIGR02999 family)